MQSSFPCQTHHVGRGDEVEGKRDFERVVVVGLGEGRGLTQPAGTGERRPAKPRQRHHPLVIKFGTPIIAHGPKSKHFILASALARIQRGRRENYAFPIGLAQRPVRGYLNLEPAVQKSTIL